MKQLQLVKSGDTFEIVYSLPIAFGSTIASIKSQLRTNDKASDLIQEFTISDFTDDLVNRNWTISATAAQTAAWTFEGVAKMDVRNTASNGKVVSTELFYVPVNAGATKI